MKSVYEILFDAVKLQGFVSQVVTQTDEEYIKLFAIAISVIPDELWNTLPQDAHIWYQNTARCINGKQPFETWPKCEGFVSVHVLPLSSTPAIKPIEKDVVAEPKQVTFNPLEEEKKRRPSPKQSKYSGSIKEIRKIVMLHPEWPARTIHKYLDGAGYAGIKFDIVSIVASETRAMIILAKDLGFWRDISIYEKTVTEEETKQTTSS